MASIRDIITSAYRYTGILPDKRQPDGNRATQALALLNQIIYRYNLENYLPFCQTTKIVGGNVQVVEWFDGDAEDTPAPMDGFTGVQIVNEKPPVSVLQASYKNGLNYVNLIVTSFQSMTEYVNPVTAIPSLCAYQRTDKAGFLYLNRPCPRELRIVYNRNIDNVSIDSDLDAPGEYIELFTLSLALKLARKYKLPVEDISVLEGEKNDILNTIQDRNKNDHAMIIYEDDTYNPYYNILSPRGW